MFKISKSPYRNGVFKVIAWVMVGRLVIVGGCTIEVFERLSVQCGQFDTHGNVTIISILYISPMP